MRGKNKMGQFLVLSVNIKIARYESFKIIIKMQELTLCERGKIRRNNLGARTCQMQFSAQNQNNKKKNIKELGTSVF
jgi:hypothetical protein